MTACAVSALAVWFFAAHGWLLYFGDAESHLNIARRLTDNATPGLDQLGSPWLPVPHVLMAPFAANKHLWQNGLAGSIPTAACFVAAAMLLFLSVFEVFGSYWSAWASILVFLLNPNGLYLQSIAMNEAYFAMAVCGLLYFTVRFRRTQHLADVAFAALFALSGTWTRYDGWFVLPFCALYFLGIARRRWLASLLFCAIAAIGPFTWIFYNWWLSGNPLDFFNGPSSAKAIQGAAPYPGLHDWHLSVLYFTNCMRLVLGGMLFWLIPFGMAVVLFKRAWWPILLLVLPPVFFVWGMHSEGNPIYMPNLEPHSWYNTRYGLAALPLAAFCAGSIIRSRWSLAIVPLCVLPWLIHSSPEQWITWKESQQNSISRRAWTQEGADYLHAYVREGEHVTAEFNDTIGVFRYAGIDLKWVFHPGNTLLWQAAVQRPDLSMRTTWVVSIRFEHDELAHAVLQAGHYQLVKMITVPGAPPLDIFHNADPLH